MDWGDVLIKALVAIAAVAGAMAAYFKWRARRRPPAEEPPQRSDDADRRSSITSGRDTNIITNSFNRNSGGKDGR